MQLLLQCYAYSAYMEGDYKRSESTSETACIVLFQITVIHKFQYDFGQTAKMLKIVASLFVLILIVNLVESGGYDCYTIFRESDRTCHRGFNNKPTPEQCCEMGAEAVGINGVNGHCQPCWEM